MNTVSINLLPEELANKDKIEAKKTGITRISVGVLMLMILITSTSLLFRIFQNRAVQEVNQELDNARNKVATLKEQESLIVYLKQRLGSISSLETQESKQAKSYNLITGLTPVFTKITLLSFDRSGNIALSVVAPSTSALNSFFNNLTDPRLNEGRVSKVRIDSLSRSIDGQYKVDLTITVS